MPKVTRLSLCVPFQELYRFALGSGLWSILRRFFPPGKGVRSVSGRASLTWGSGGPIASRTDPSPPSAAFVPVSEIRRPCLWGFISGLLFCSIDLSVSPSSTITAWISAVLSWVSSWVVSALRLDLVFQYWVGYSESLAVPYKSVCSYPQNNSWGFSLRLR